MKTPLLHCVFFAITLSGAAGQIADRYPTDWHPSKYEGPLPLHPAAEFYIAYLSSGDERVSRPNPKFFWQNPVPIYLGPMMSYEPQFPTAQFDFVGRSSKGDLYIVSFQADASSKEQKKKVVYFGSALEVFKEGNFAVGIRPAKENK